MVVAMNFLLSRFPGGKGRGLSSGAGRVKGLGSRSEGGPRRVTGEAPRCAAARAPAELALKLLVW